MTIIIDLSTTEKLDAFGKELQKQGRGNGFVDLGHVAKKSVTLGTDIITRLRSGDCLCLNCGPGYPNWTTKHGGIEYPVCAECDGLAISWDHVCDGLGGTMSERDWRKLEERYPEVIVAAETAEQPADPLRDAAKRALDYLIGCPGEDVTEIAEQLREALNN